MKPFYVNIEDKSNASKNLGLRVNFQCPSEKCVSSTEESFWAISLNQLFEEKLASGVVVF